MKEGGSLETSVTVDQNIRRHTLEHFFFVSLFETSESNVQVTGQITTPGQGGFQSANRINLGKQEQGALHFEGEGVIHLLPSSHVHVNLSTAKVNH
jgi:hypothetical protein